MKKIWLLGGFLLACSTLLHAVPASTAKVVVNPAVSELGRELDGDLDNGLDSSLDTEMGPGLDNGLDTEPEMDQPNAFDAAHTELQPGSASIPSYDDVPVDAIRRFVSIYEKVKANYVEPVDDNELFENALHGLLSKLDPYSDYLDTKTYEALLDFTEGEVAQTGLTVRPLSGADASWQIDRVDIGSPAARAGLQEGMLLYRIDGKSTRTLSQHDIDQLLRGTVGTTVELSVAAPDKHSQIVRVIRAMPEDNAVKVIAQPDGVLVLKVSAFQSQTASQITQAIEDYQKTASLKAVMLDLRDNPGGLLSAAVEVADLFLSEGLIVYTKGRGEPEQRYQALPPARYAQLPVGVLVNHYSASAAEVLAGAFQDHQRAVVIGENSYGKGSVQKLWPIADGYAIKLTVARYYTPKDRLIEGKGIQPDILIKDQPLAAEVDTTLDNSIAMLRKYYQLP
jgi:carboxyl-terminal processing protease